MPVGLSGHWGATGLGGCAEALTSTWEVVGEWDQDTAGKMELRKKPRAWV